MYQIELVEILKRDREVVMGASLLKTGVMSALDPFDRVPESSWPQPIQIRLDNNKNLL